MSATGDIIRRLRQNMKLSQAELGSRVGSDQKTISRVEAGAEPGLLLSIRLAEFFRVSVHTIAAIEHRGPDLTGDDWWAGWQTWGTGDVERIDVHELRIVQDGEFLKLEGDRARSIAEGSYAWTGEMRIHDGEALLGWYVAADGSVRSKGTMYMSLHPHGQMMVGSWTGQSFAGLIVRGWAAISRNREQVQPLIDSLIANNGNLKAWPTIS